MKNNKSFVHYSEFLPIYHKLPVDKKPVIAGVLGYKSCNQLIKSKYMTRYYFKKLIEFKEHICKDKESFNYIGTPLSFDIEQLKLYYSKLNEWIESDEYVNSTLHQRSRIIDEQKRISKQLNNQ